MIENVRQHYYQYYQYEISARKEPGEIVNGLYEAVMRNDKAALEQVLRILGSNIYYLAYKRLANVGRATLDNIDDLMQNIRFEIIKISFRGFPEEKIKEQYQGNFYGWLMGVSENCIKNYKKYDERHNQHIQYDTINYSVFEVMEEKGSEGSNKTPEQEMIKAEKLEITEKILRNFIVVLEKSELPPYQLLTYCYAVLLPQILKKTDKKELLHQINIISERSKNGKKSYYDEQENCLGGAIARESVILLNWALSAMEEQNLTQLDNEFLELYEMERIADMPFKWKTAYYENMEKEYKKNLLVKQIIITSEFEKNTIKNWPIRVAKTLYLETEKQLICEKDFQKKAVGIIEEMLR